MIRKNLLVGLLCLVSLHAPAEDASAKRSAAPGQPPLETIAALDVARYMGTWYEIARYPNWFQKKCIGQAQADYRLLGDGKVEVINRCRTADGEISEAIGLARQKGPASSAKLEVRFAPAWLSFLPFVWGDYWIIDLDPDYRLVAVGEPGRKYLWILSRSPEVDPASYRALLDRLRAKGFDPERLESGRRD